MSDHQEINDQTVRQLLDPDAFPHPVHHPRLMQTHISWIILTGSFAYKIKKPVRHDFLDYSTLELRLESCRRELEINRRFAPSLYLDVVPIVMQKGRFQVAADLSSGSAPIVEYAVKMREFDQGLLLSSQFESSRGELPGLPVDQMDQLAGQIVAYHASAPVAGEGSRWRSTSNVYHAARENFDFLLEHLADPEVLDTVAHLRQWTEAEIKNREQDFERRPVDGHIRECHGDLHLGNLLFDGERFTAFDAIEFNESFRWIDTMNEVAFPMMDLDDRGFGPYARRFLNRYLEVSGDYDGLTVLRFYLVYRAMIRAKVDLMGSLQSDGQSSADLSESGLNYLRHAVQYSAPGRPRLWIMHGLSGSGKSSAAIQLVENDGFIRLRSDFIRKRHAGLAESTTAPASHYTREATQRVYHRMYRLAEMILCNGYSVVVDATFLRSAERDLFRDLAARLQVNFHIATCQASRQELLDRIATRGQDASDATKAVVEKQLHSYEPLSEAERAVSIPWSDSRPFHHDLKAFSDWSTEA